ncbi:UPF0573 protein C2orf70 homolog B-like [Stylophora pistillata]|uniref:UPF0573 protein C2orf70 homolog B-like n=1 Tax=Stylophora pistillata TaxID=50429 RepID=UPI000C03BE87|nr:UPF0573 protein C2orf70 homolog B-like [Stylophora pistillata]
MLGYAGHCHQAKFWNYGDTFGNTTAKYFQDRRIAKLNNSKATQPGTYGDGRPEFLSVYSNTPNLVLAARMKTRERRRNAKKYSLFNEHERGREVKKFDQLFTSDNLSASKLAQSHREYYKDRSGTVLRVEQFVIPRKVQPAITRSPLCEMLVEENGCAFTTNHGLSYEMSPPMACTWRDRGLRDVYFEKR